MGVQLGQRSNGWTRGWDWRPRDSKVDSPNKWVSYPPRRPLSDVIRLLAFLMVALARSTVLMALLAYKPAKERQHERQTDKRRRRDKGLEAKETAAKREKKQKAHYFTGANAGNYAGQREKGWRVKRTEATTRGGVVGCGQICCEGWFLLDLYFINYLRSCAHTPRTRIQARVTLSCLSVLTPSKRVSQVIF